MIDTMRIQSLTKEFLIAIGEDPNRDGLRDTPRRVAEMFEELLVHDTKKSLTTSFQADNYNGIVLIKNIDFASICEHHIVPFIGKANVAYIPGDEVLGLSKIGRIIEKHCKKLQLQERLANEIVNEIEQTVKPKGVAIYMEAKHLCMNIRGISKVEASTITTVFCGDFKELRLQELFVNMVSN